jgi:hypothetical protein
MEYTVKKRNTSTEKDIIDDMIKIMHRLGKSSITIREYDIYGAYNSSTAIRKIGAWNTILKRLYSPLNNVFYNDEDLLNNIKDVWLQKGTQPTRRDMDNKNWSQMSSCAYLRHFGTWYKALDRFVEYINKEDGREIVPAIFLCESKTCHLDLFYSHKSGHP